MLMFTYKITQIKMLKNSKNLPVEQQGTEESWADMQNGSPPTLSKLAVTTATEIDIPSLPPVPEDVLDARTADVFDRLRRQPPPGVPELKEAIGPTRGWKIHLNFDPTAHSGTVRDSLSEINDQFSTENGEKVQFKIGMGGGKTAGSPGTEATIYVGAMSDLQRYTELIKQDEVLSRVLLPPGYDQLLNDVPVGGLESNVWARFEALNANGRLSSAGLGELMQYGRSGASTFREFSGVNPDRDMNLEYVRSVEKLCEVFGDAFVGKDGEYFDMVVDASRYKQAVLAALEPIS